MKQGLTRDEITAKIRRAVPLAARRALSTSIDNSLSKVAKDTGKMRREIKRDLAGQLKDQSNAKDIQLTMSSKRISARVPYAKYHWVVGPRGQRSYKSPTTPGTAPIQPVLFLRPYRAAFKTQLIIALKNEGLNVI